MLFHIVYIVAKYVFKKSYLIYVQPFWPIVEKVMNSSKRNKQKEYG